MLRPNSLDLDIDLSLRRETLGEQAANTLRHVIATGRLAPGARLVETEMARMLKVSRGPVRDAIKKLAEEGLVFYSPGDGAYVADFSPDDLRALVGLRARMEEYALELAVQRITPEGIAQLRHLLTAMSDAARQNDFSTMWAYDAELHRVIWSHTGSRRLAELLSLTISPLFVWQMRVTPVRQQELPDPHALMVEALAKRDSAAAKAALRMHMQGVARNLGVADSKDGM